MAVYLPGHFFHLLNIQHPDLICHSLFLTGTAIVFLLWTWSIWVFSHLSLLLSSLSPSLPTFLPPSLSCFFFFSFGFVVTLMFGWKRGPFICWSTLFFIFLPPGNNEVIDMLPHSPLQSLSGSLVLNWCSGKLYRAFLNQSYLLQFLWNTRLDCEKIAVLHCVLSCGQNPQFLEAKVGT